jgi:hypothetical protein
LISRLLDLTTPTLGAVGINRFFGEQVTQTGRGLVSAVKSEILGLFHRHALNYRRGCCSRAMGTLIGYACGGLAVALIVFSILAAAGGGGEGMLPLLVGFGLLLVAVGALRPSKTRL